MCRSVEAWKRGSVGVAMMLALAVYCLGAAGGETMEIVLTPQMLSIIPLLAVALQMLKGIEPLAKLKPWFPLLSILVAMGLAVVMKMGVELQDQLFAGIVMGLATSGGYDAAKLPTKVTEAKAPAAEPGQ